MTKDLLAYLEKIRVCVSSLQRQRIENILVQKYVSHMKGSCVNSMRREVGAHKSQLATQAEFFQEQIVDLACFRDACSIMQSFATKKFHDYGLQQSWIAAALLAMIELIGQLDQQEVRDMRSRNAVLISTFDKGSVSNLELAVLEVRFRKAASLQNIFQRKTVVVDLSCYFYAGSNKK